MRLLALIVRIASVLGRSLLWLLLLAVALGASLLYHTELPLSRRIARDLVNHFVTGEIRGELVIGRFDELTLQHAVARYVSLYDGEGRRIIAADRVEITPQFGELRHGVLRFKVGRVIGATVRLIDNGEGEPSFFTTFNPRHPSSGPSHGEPLHALVDRLELVDATLYGQFIQLRGVRAEHVYATGRLEVAHTVEVAIEKARGQVVRPFDFVGEIEKLRGTVSTDEVRGTKLYVRGTRGDEDVRARIEYRSPAPHLPQELDIDLHSDKLSPSTLRSVGYAFAGPLAPMLSGDVHLSGPPEQLALTAKVDSIAGKADVTGTVSSAHGLSVRVTTQSMAADELVDGAPAVTLRGAVNISVPEGSDIPRVHAEIAGLRYKGVIVPAFQLDGALEDNGLRIDKARATQNGQIALRGRVGFDGRSDLYVDAHFAAVQRDPNLSRFTPNLEGTLTAALHIRTPGNNRPQLLDITGKLQLNDARYGWLSASHLTLSGAALGDPQLPKLDVRVQGDGVQFLSYSLGTAEFSLRGGPHDYSARGEFALQGQKTLNFDAQISADRSGFVIQAEPIEFTVGTESWRGLIHDLTVINEHSVRLGFLRLASRAQRLEARGILQSKGEDSLEAQLQNFDLTALRAVLGERFPITHGYADANLAIKGHDNRPELSLQGAVREAKLYGLSDLDALYVVGYKSGQIELDSEIDFSGEGTVHLTGQGELDPAIADPREALQTGLYNASLTSSDFELSMVPALRRYLRAGKLDGSIDAQGGLDSVTISGKLSGTDLEAFDSKPVKLETSFHYDHDDLSARLHASDAHGALGRGVLDWHANWRELLANPQAFIPEMLANDFRLRGRLLDRPLEDWPVAVPWPGAGMLRASSSFDVTRSDGHLNGTLDTVVQPKAALQDLSCQLSMASALHALWQLHDDHADLAFDAQLDGRKVAAASGNISYPFDALLRGEHPDVRPRAALQGQANIADLQRVPGLCEHGRGPLHASWDLRDLWSDAPSADIDVQGTLSPELRVTSGATDQKVNACENEPLRLAAGLSGRAGVVTFHAQAQGCSAGPIGLQGSVPVLWNGQHVLPVLDENRETRADLDMRDAQLQPLLDYVPGVLGFSGKASGQLSVRAKHHQVDYRGQIALSGGRLYALSTGQELRDIELALIANGSWMKLDSLHARIGRGSIDAAGGIGFEGWAPRRLQIGLVLKDFPIQREGIELAWLTGSSAVAGDIGATRSQMAVKIHQLAVRLPSASSRSPQSLEPHPDITLTTEPPRSSSRGAYEFEFAIDGRQQITARRNDFEAALATELAIRYRDPDLNVGGYIEFRRGSFDVFGKSFQLNRGSLHFAGTTELNPEVSLVATHEPDAAGGSPVIVNVSGTLAKPVVEFHSDRCPGEGAVVLLVSGRCPSESDSVQSDPTTTQDAFAAGIIGGILTLGARRELGGLIPRLSVESSAQGTRTRLKAGFEAVPKFMRSLVQRVYLQGALSTSDAGTVDTNTTQSVTTPDFLIELYFPNNIVGAGKMAPTTRSWGLDVTWEP